MERRSKTNKIKNYKKLHELAKLYVDDIINMPWFDVIEENIKLNTFTESPINDINLYYRIKCFLNPEHPDHSTSVIYFSTLKLNIGKNSKFLQQK